MASVKRIYFHIWLKFIVYKNILKGVISKFISVKFVYGLLIQNSYVYCRYNQILRNMKKVLAILFFDFRKLIKVSISSKIIVSVYGDVAISEKAFTRLRSVNLDQEDWKLSVSPAVVNDDQMKTLIKNDLTTQGISWIVNISMNIVNI